MSRSYLSLIATALIGVSCTPKSVDGSVQNNIISQSQHAEGNALEKNAREKIATLKELMEQAEAHGISVKREETLLWFSESFLTFADWDEKNAVGIEAAFSYYGPYADQKTDIASNLPNFERREVIQMLEDGINILGKEIDGEIKRPEARPVDWGNIEVGDNVLRSRGKPVFLYDYFSKTVGQPLTNKDIYNDHLGAIFHGGENLYPENHDRAVNPYLLREDGSFDSELWAEVADIPDTNVGFLILWNMGVPDWIKQKEPEVEKGRSLFTGFDIDNPLMRDAWGKILRRTGEQMRGHKVTQLGYIFSNEPHWFSEDPHWTARFREMNEISSYTLNGFRSWLDNTYSGDIDTLNTNWKSNFSNFQQVNITIPIPRSERGTPRWYDWSRYNMDRVIDWFTHLQNELHSVAPEADTHIKIMPGMFTHNARSHGIDIERLTELTTMIGDDAQAVAGPGLTGNRDNSWIDHYAYYWHELAVGYDFLESVAPDKIHVNSESHFLSVSWWRDLEMSPNYVRNVYWLATLMGMDANMGWFWARDPDGSPEDRLEGELNFFDPALAGSYAASVNMQPRVANEVTQVMLDLNSVSEEITELREQRRPVRLFYSETSAINKPNHMTQQEKLHESLFFEGFPLGYATQRILEKQNHRQWDVIIVSQTEYVTDDEIAAIQTYLDQKGTVIVHGDESLMRDEYGYRRNNFPLKALKGKLIRINNDQGLDGLREETLKHIEDSQPMVGLQENSQHANVHWRSVERADGSHLVNAFNLGRDAVSIDMGTKAGKITRLTNLMTGEEMSTTITLEPMDVLLLEVTLDN